MTNDAAFTGTIPNIYDQGLGPVIFEGYAADIAKRVAAGSPARVLETAAGTGIVTRNLRDALPTVSHLTSTDLNAPMLDVARSKFTTNEAVDFQVADATSLPFADASFDAVVCQFGLMFFPDKAASFREVHRVLEAGGTYVFSVWDSHRYNPFGRLSQAVIDQFFPIDPPGFYHAPFSCSAIDPVKTWMSDAGFTEIVIRVLPRTQEIKDLDAFCRAQVFGNPLAEQVRARGGDPLSVVVAIRDRLQAELQGGPMPMQAIVFSGRKPG